MQGQYAGVLSSLALRSDMMKSAAICFRCTVSSCMHMSFCVLCACVCPQEAIQIQLWSQLGESGEGVATRKWVPTCKIDVRRWGTGEEWRDEWMNKTKSASDWEVPSRILRLYLLRRQLVCVDVHAREFFSMHLRNCVYAICAHKGNTIALQAVPAARDTQPRWADEKWIKEQQMKGRKAE